MPAGCRCRPVLGATALGDDRRTLLHACSAQAEDSQRLAGCGAAQYRRAGGEAAQIAARCCAARVVGAAGFSCSAITSACWRLGRWDYRFFEP